MCNCSQREVVVVWNKLADFEQDLIVAMFNSNGSAIGGREHKQKLSLWLRVTINHPEVDIDEDNSIWDPGAEVVEIEGVKRLKIYGMTEPHGMGKDVSFVLPANHKLSINAFVE